ncbi:MAG TPA: hypothetical protein VHN74_13720 [Candidatus Angelobacter sp.]|nr:hypothetical protein [Candidatus Angelobacter sp.]
MRRVGNCAERQRFNRFIRPDRFKSLKQLGLNRSNITQQFRLTVHNSQQFRSNHLAQQYITEQHFTRQL